MDFTIELLDEARVCGLPPGKLALVARREDGERRSLVVSRETVADPDAARAVVDDLLASFN